MINTGSDIIKKFELWTDDQTELSTAEELFLANEKQREILNEGVWEFARKSAGGSFSNGEIDLSTVAPDFKHIMSNYCDNDQYTTPTDAVVYVNETPYKVIHMGMRQQLKARPVCWIDPTQNKIKFSDTGTSGLFSFDYQVSPPDFTEETAPLIPVDHRMTIVYAMLLDDDIIQKTEKARSNIKENMSQYIKLLSNLKSYNAKFIMY